MNYHAAKLEAAKAVAQGAADCVTLPMRPSHLHKIKERKAEWRDQAAARLAQLRRPDAEVFELVLDFFAPGWTTPVSWMNAAWEWIRGKPAMNQTATNSPNAVMIQNSGSGPVTVTQGLSEKEKRK
jgi:hypothetical protein